MNYERYFNGTLQGLGKKDEVLGDKYCDLRDIQTKFGNKFSWHLGRSAGKIPR